MNLCQPNSPFSCGACCGLFNLEIDILSYKKILSDRTIAFNEKVNFQISWTIPEYRKLREIEEANFPKKDEHIYNCPFLGYINESNTKIGCMIHPVFSKDPLSQNFSFYGSSICQGYDCKNKENSESEVWEKILSSLDLDSISYSNLAGDHIFLSYLLDYISESGFSLKSFWNEKPSLLKAIIFQKLSNENRNITSFEIEMEPRSGDSAKERIKNKYNMEI